MENRLTASQDNFLQCPHCSKPQFFKGQRGLNIHFGKKHKINANQSTPNIDNLSNCTDSPNLYAVETPLWKILTNLRNNKPVLRRIPRGARTTICRTLSNLIRLVLNQNSLETWTKLLTFPYLVLHIKTEQDEHISATQKIKNNCSTLDQNLFPLGSNNTLPTTITTNNPRNKIGVNIIERKISDGDIRGAARLLFSSDAVAPDCADTLAALREKHPPSSPNTTLPSPPDSESALAVTMEDVGKAVASFQSGSAGGLDGLTPQHLKDLLGEGSREAGESLLRDVTALINFMISGKVTNEITDILYGASLCALRKKDGGIRPIAVGTVYRRLAAKCCCRKKTEYLKEYFQPHQLGFGSRSGSEAAVHSLRTFLHQSDGNVLIKVDIKNAFNSLDRSALLSQVREKIPDCYPFLWQCYSQNSKLTFRQNLLYSEVGCQQGDPLGPAIFSLGIHPIISNLKSKFNVWYLDDGTLGGEVDTVLQDLAELKTKLLNIGLEINYKKCELFINKIDEHSDIISKFQNLAPGIKILNSSSLRLLGAPIFDESIPDFVEENIQNFRVCSDRLPKINTHMAFTIVRYCLFVPKFTYALRCCQLWKKSTLLQQLDSIVRDTLITILNLDMDDRTWLQASLPVRLGGLGVRKISSIALPAFLSSAHSTNDLVCKILQTDTLDNKIPFLSDAKKAWLTACPKSSLPTALASQRAWDGPLCELTREKILNTCTSSAERARLLAVASWESGQWLQAHPSFTTGTFLDNSTFRIAASLRLGAPCCVPHRCHCGTMVDRYGHHGLSCLYSAGRRSRHASLNDVIRRYLASASVPAILEPNGLMRDDGKRPDGMSLIPWKMGRPLVWDATCADTLALSHLPRTEAEAAGAASSAEDFKRRKYGALGNGYIFVAFGVETLGPWGPSAKSFHKELGKRLFEVTGDRKASSSFAQQISIAIQRGNAASLLGTLPSGIDQM